MSGQDELQSNDVNVRNGNVTDRRGPKRRVVFRVVVHDRIFRTVCLFVGFGVMGLSSPLLGNTLVHLERLFGVDTTTIALSFTGHSVGYLVGSIVCGFMFDRVNHELAFAIANFVQGLATIVAPFLGAAGGVAGFIAAMCLQALSQGFIDAGGQSYCVGLWAGHRMREPILQALHAVWSLGGMISPFIIARFLVELPHSPRSYDTGSATDWTTTFDATLINSTESETQEAVSAASATSSHWNTTNPTSDTTDGIASVVNYSKVRFAYIIVGSLVFVATVLFVVAFLRDRLRQSRAAKKTTRWPPVAVALKKSSDDDADDQVTDPLSGLSQTDENPVETSTTVSSRRSVKRDRFIFLAFIALIFLFYHLYLYVEFIPIAYLTSFSVKYLDMSIHNASLLMSIFFGFHFAGRLLGIPLSAFLRPRTMLIADLTLTAAANLLLLFFVHLWPAIIWPTTALVGVSMATTFATAVLWIADLVTLTGGVASVLLVGSSLGGLIGPLFVGRMFDSSTPMWFVYVTVVASVSHMVLLCGMMSFVKRFGDRLKNTATDGRLDVTATSVDGERSAKAIPSEDVKCPVDGASSSLTRSN